MKRIAAMICIMVAMLLFAGCMQQQEEKATVTPTTVPTTVHTTVTTPKPTATTPSTPSVDIIPPEKMVSVSVFRDQVTPTIRIRFDGGKGQAQVTRIDVQVTRSDGQRMMDKLTARVNEELEFTGTKGRDRVEVWVSYTDGTRYKLLDRYYDYYER